MKAFLSLFAFLLPWVAQAHPGHLEAALGPHHLHGLGELALGMAVIAVGWLVKRQTVKSKSRK